MTESLNSIPNRKPESPAQEFTRVYGEFGDMLRGQMLEMIGRIVQLERELTVARATIDELRREKNIEILTLQERIDRFAAPRSKSSPYDAGIKRGIHD